MRFSPALCTPYQRVRLDLPCFAQPKLNGIRAVYRAVSVLTFYTGCEVKE